MNNFILSENKKKDHFNEMVFIILKIKQSKPV